MNVSLFWQRNYTHLPYWALSLLFGKIFGNTLHSNLALPWHISCSYTNSCFYFHFWLGHHIDLVIHFLPLCIPFLCCPIIIITIILILKSSIQIAWYPWVITVDILWVSPINILQLCKTCNHYRDFYLIHITSQVVKHPYLVHWPTQILGTKAYHCDWAIPHKATILPSVA